MRYHSHVIALLCAATLGIPAFAEMKVTFLLDNPQISVVGIEVVGALPAGSHDCSHSPGPRTTFTEMRISFGSPQRLSVFPGEYCFRREDPPFPPHPEARKSPSPEFDAYMKALDARTWTEWSHFFVKRSGKMIKVR